MTNPTEPRRTLTRTTLLGIILVLGFGLPAIAEEAAEGDELTERWAAIQPFFDALAKGNPIFDVNFRWEYAKTDTLQHSHGATVRTRLGYETMAFYGFTGLAEMINTASPKPSGYFDGTGNNSAGRSQVSDPERTDVNRVWLQFAKEEWADLELKTGRQRVIFDDARFIGNVGWRQNEQTFDAVSVQTSLGMENLVVQYVYAWEVNRIFADQGGPENVRDYGPKSHFVNLKYRMAEALEIVGFFYHISPNSNAYAIQASQTYGTRLTGRVKASEESRLFLDYQVSAAYQRDAGRNPEDVDTYYLMLEPAIGVKAIGKLAVGYEVLGSDNGDAVIATPFSTAHKFNGFADVFLNNGGPRGLRDVYVRVIPEVPVDGATFEFQFHQFYDDTGGDNLGQEYDFVTSYQVNEYLGFLYKFAYFDGGKNRSPLTTTRSILQTTIKF